MSAVQSLSAVQGLSAFPITPSGPDGRVDVAALRRLVAPLADAGVDSIGLLGSTGSYPYLTRGERRRAIDAALDAAGGRVPILVGVGALRTDEALRLAEDARAAGAAAGLLAPVSYTPLTEGEVFEHFAAVARAGLPLCIYDNPSTTHFAFTPELVGRVARLDGVVALKSLAPPPEAVAAHLGALRAAGPAGLSIGYSVDWHAADALLAGADAWYGVAAGLFPARCLAILRAARAGDAAEARRLDAAMRPLWDLFKAHSSLRVAYAAAEALEICSAEPPRPLLPLPRALRDRVAEVVRGLGPA